MVLVLGAAAGLPWTTHDVFVLDIDAALYLRSSLSLLRGDGYTYLGEPFELRPPGFPLLLAPVLGVVGTDFRAIHVYVSLWGIAAVALLFVFLRERLGDFPSFALAAALWVNPLVQDLCNRPMSDVPGLTLLLLALLAERRARRSGHRRDDVITGVAIAAATYVRSLSVLLLPALVLSRFVPPHRTREGWRGTALLVGTCLILLAPWSVRNGMHEQEAPSDQTWLYSQWVAMSHTDRGDPASPVISRDELLHRPPRRFRWIASEVGNRLRASQSTTPHLALGILGGILLVVVAIRRRRTSEIFAIGSSAVLLVWHAQPERLLIPLFAFVGAAVLESALPVVARVTGRPASRAVLAVAVLGIGLLDARHHVDWTKREVEHRERREAAQALSSWLEDGDVLAETIRPWSDAVYLDRPIFNVRPALRRGGSAAAADVIEKHGINVLIIRSGTERTFREYAEQNFTCTIIEPGVTICRRPRPSPAAPTPSDSPPR